MGRPTKLNDLITDASGHSTTRFEIAVRALQSGQTRRVAAMLAGVGHTTFFNWLAKGEKQTQGQYREFRDAVIKAQALAEVRLVNAVYRCVEGAVFELPCYGEKGARIIDERTGKPKTKRVVMMPDGRLGLRLLALRNPAEWGGRAQAENAPAASDKVGIGTIDLFKEAIATLIEHGETVPAELTRVISAPQMAAAALPQPVEEPAVPTAARHHR